MGSRGGGKVRGSPPQGQSEGLALMYERDTPHACSFSLLQTTDRLALEGQRLEDMMSSRDRKQPSLRKNNQEFSSFRLISIAAIVMKLSCNLHHGPRTPRSKSRLPHLNCSPLVVPFPAAYVILFTLAECFVVLLRRTRPVADAGGRGMTSYGGGSHGEEWAWAFDTGFLNFGGLMDDGCFLSQRTCDTVCRIGASHQVCGNSCWWVCADRLRTRATGVGGRDNGGKPNQVLGIIPCEIGRERTDLFSPVFSRLPLGRMTQTREPGGSSPNASPPQLHP